MQGLMCLSAGATFACPPEGHLLLLLLQEDEAARSFDRAAIRLRGERAKLNYKLADYKDEFGNIVEDKKLSVRQHLLLSCLEHPALVQ